MLCPDKPPEIKHNPKFEKWYSSALDIFHTKIFKPNQAGNNKTKTCPKNVFTVMFCNKGMEEKNLNRSLKSKGSITLLPEKIEAQENIPVATYRLTLTVRNLRKISYLYKTSTTIKNVNIKTLIHKF